MAAVPMPECVLPMTADSSTNMRRVVVLLAMLVVAAAATEIPFYAHQIYALSWEAIQSSSVDWKNQAPFTDSTFLRAVVPLCLVLGPLLFVLVVVTSAWRIKGASLAERVLRIAACAAASAAMLPYVLHSGRLVSWYLD